MTEKNENSGKYNMSSFSGVRCKYQWLSLTRPLSLHQDIKQTETTFLLECSSHRHLVGGGSNLPTDGDNNNLRWSEKQQDRNKKENIIKKRGEGWEKRYI